MKIEKTIYQNLLKVKVTVRKAQYIGEEKIKITTKEIMDLVKSPEEYEISGILKEGAPVKNFLKNDGDCNTSTWVFSILKKDQNKQTKRATRKKTGQTKSLRGRMSKIAKEIKTPQED